MMPTSDNVIGTGFTHDWERFEERLATFLGQLALPTLNDTVRIRYPLSGDGFGEVVMDGTFGGQSSDESSGSAAYEMGVSVQLPGQPVQFYPVADDIRECPEAARAVCEFLREVALVPHHSMLTATSDRIDFAQLARLGLHGPDTTLGLPPVSWPRSVQETQEVLEQVLTWKYGTANIDSDGEYVVDTRTDGGTRFYLTVINDQPAIAFRKHVVLIVNSRQAAVIEANYLNRENSEIRWVLRGHTLSQELHLTTAPFAPARFVELLDLFDTQYRATASSLQLRLGQG